MGGLTDKPATSNQTNVNNPMLTDAFKPALGYVTGGGNMLGSLLGLNGPNAQTGSLTNFANSAGMGFLRDQGNQQITSSQASRGLLDSGATGKALVKYGEGLGSTYLNQYMSNLKDYAGIGLGAGNILAQSGVEKHDKGAKKGILSTISGNIKSAAGASDGGGG